MVMLIPQNYLFISVYFVSKSLISEKKNKNYFSLIPVLGMNVKHVEEPNLVILKDKPFLNYINENVSLRSRT